MAAPAASPSPPYVSFRTLLHFLDWLREVGLPPRLERSFWGRKVSGAGGAHLMAAFRFLGLLDGTDRPTPELEAVIADPARARARLRTCLERSYQPVLAGTRLDKATKEQILERLRQRGLEGATLRKAATFLVHAARFLDVPISPQVAEGSRRREAGPSGRAGAGKRPGGLSRVSPLLLALFERLPPPGRPWAARDRAQWVKALQAALSLEYPEN
jgi:hypothetical protein